MKKSMRRDRTQTFSLRVDAANIVATKLCCILKKELRIIIANAGMSVVLNICDLCLNVIFEG